MSRVLYLDAFPSIFGDGAQLLGAFRSGIERQKNDMTLFRLSYLKINDCVACPSCQYPCVLQDDGNAVLKAIEATDVIAFAFPLSSFGFPSVLTALLDRLVSLPKAKWKHKRVLFFIIGNPDEAASFKESCAKLCQKEAWEELAFLVFPSSHEIGQERFLGHCETVFQLGLHLL